MYSTDDDSANPAEKCPLHELPSTLLYAVTKNLDISSQRSLFLASLHLYRQWHLQVPEEDHEWRFLNWSLDVLAQISSQSGCDMRDGRTFINAYFSDIDRQARISNPGQQRNNFAALLSSDDRDLDVDAFVESLLNPTSVHQGLLTKEQLLKRCISSPGLDGSSIAFAEDNTVNQQELKALAHRLFSLLLKNEGFVVFRFVRHANLLVTHLQDGWKINLKPCSVNPPVIDLNAYTGERCDLWNVWGKLYSRGSLASNSLSDINLSSWVLSENRRRS